MPQIHQASPIFFNGPSCCLLQIVRVLSRSSFHSPFPFLPDSLCSSPSSLPLCLTSAPLDTGKVGRQPSGHKTCFISWLCPNNPAALPTKIFQDAKTANLVSLFQPTVLFRKIKTIIACFKMFICFFSFHRMFPWFMANILLQRSNSLKKKPTTTQNVILLNLKLLIYFLFCILGFSRGC